MPRLIWSRRAAAAATIAIAAVAAVSVAAAVTSDDPSVSPVPLATPLSPLESLAAFRDPATAADARLSRQPFIRDAIAQLTAPDAGAPPEFHPGTPRNDLRVLLSGLGEGGRAIFAFTTSKSRTCLGLTGFTSGCYAGLPLGASVDITVGDPDDEGSGEGALVWGIARNDVRAVEVEVGSGHHAATLGRNAYFFQLTDASLPTSAITAVIVHREDGVTQRLAVR